MCARKTVQM